MLQTALKYYPMYTLSKNLQYLMEIQNINKNQLAKVLAIPSMSVGRWVNGKVTDPTLSKLLLLSNFFDITIDDLTMHNLQVEDKVKKLFDIYVNIPIFEWNEKPQLEDKMQTCQIPKILLNDINTQNCFSMKLHSEYYGLYPKNSRLIFTNATLEHARNDILLVKNIIIGNILLIKCLSSGYFSVLTNEKVELMQYEIIGVVINMVLSNVFLSII